jgi:transposase
MLADQIDHVIGVDTHKDSHSTAVVNPTGAVVANRTVAADAFGYKRIHRFALEHAPGRRVWAIEGTGSFGSGLTTYLLEQGEWVVEIDRPARPARRNGAKSDALDAARAAREALGREHLAQPRRRGDREAVRVLLATRQGAVQSRTRAICHLKALVVNAPEALRHQLRKLDTDQLLARCARLRTGPSQSVEHRATITGLRCTARRALALEAEANDLESELEKLMVRLVPQLLAEPGVGVISAAQIVNAWSHAGRLRSEAAFAALGGAAPIEASSGKVVRHRLNRGGDRQLNRALHTIVLSRQQHHPATRSYTARRTAEGKTPGRSSGASSATCPAACSGSSKRPQPLPNTTGSRALDSHRSILAIGLGHAVVAAGYRVSYATAADLVARCHRAAIEGRWATTMRSLATPRLLIIDELGYLPLQAEGAAALFQVIAQRYLKGSIALTTNRGIASWGQIFDDPMVAAAMLDRLLHRSTVLSTKGTQTIIA